MQYEKTPTVNVTVFFSPLSLFLAEDNFTEM